MPVPVLVAVDQDQGALEDVVTQLSHRYERDYGVEGLSDPEEAHRKLAQLARDGEEVALLLAGESLLNETGRELLDQAHQLHPRAKRGLVVAGGAWENRPKADAILDAMALGRVDYYVPRPAASPDEVFHQTIASVLLEWATERRTVPQTVHIVGETWSGRAFELREIFARCAVPHAFCLADSEQGRELLAKAGSQARLPLMVLPGGRSLSDPSNGEIAAAAGAPTDFEQCAYDLAIVGSGPAGLSAAVYGSSEGLRTLVVDEGGIGGQVRSSSLIRNYLGFPRGVSGSRLAEQAHEQASIFGASFLFLHAATGLSRSEDRLEISLSDGRSVSAAAVILATGATYRRLGVSSLEGLSGAGVFYGGPVSEAHALIGKDAYVAGGGNSAGQAARHLARYARRVTLLVRGASLEAGMSQYLVRQLEDTPNVDVRTHTTVVGGGGEGHLEELVLRERTTGEQSTVPADALFVLIGAHPRTDWLPEEIARDGHGFLYTGEDVPRDHGWPLDRRPLALETSMPGVLAAGDVRHASVKRVASAVGEGSTAVQLLHGLSADERSWLPTQDGPVPASAGAR